MLAVGLQEGDSEACGVCSKKERRGREREIEMTKSYVFCVAN